MLRLLVYFERALRTSLTLFENVNPVKREARLPRLGTLFLLSPSVLVLDHHNFDPCF